MTLIFLNRYFHPDHSATSQMLSDLAFALAADGHKVRVITSRQLYETAGKALPARERIDGVDVTRVWTSRFGRMHLAGRAIDYLSFHLTAAFALWTLARRGDVVIAKTDPPMLSMVAAPVAWMRGAVLVNWLQDIFPEVAEAVGMGGGRLGLFVFGALRGLRNRSLRSAQMNVALGEHMAERLQKLAIPPDRIRIIANWADGKSIHPAPPEQNRLRRDWARPHDFIVAYSGNLGRAHEIATMLHAIEITQHCVAPRIVWLFVGGGTLMQALQEKVACCAPAPVIFKPYQPQELLAESLSVADVHLVSLRPELEGLIVPSKIYGIQAAGRPAIFIGDPDGEIARQLARTESGLTVTAGDGAGLAAAIQQLAADPDRCRKLGLNARRAFEREFDKPIAMARWAALLDEVAHRARAKT